jgi:hypothetical protein
VVAVVVPRVAQHIARATVRQARHTRAIARRHDVTTGPVRAATIRLKPFRWYLLSASLSLTLQR